MTPSGGLSGISGIIEWIKLATRYLSRPMVDPLALPGDNKAIFGFNLIWMFGIALADHPIGLECSYVLSYMIHMNPQIN